MEKALHAKFTQNEAQKQKMMAAKGRFVECNKLDKTWGIGLALHDEDATKPDKWLGTNLLGKLLDKVKESIEN